MKLVNAWIIVIAISVFVMLGISQASTSRVPRNIYSASSIGPVLVFIIILGFTVLILDIFRSEIKFLLWRLNLFRVGILTNRGIFGTAKKSPEPISGRESVQIDPELPKELDGINPKA